MHAGCGGEGDGEAVVMVVVTVAPWEAAALEAVAKAEGKQLRNELDEEGE